MPLLKDLIRLQDALLWSRSRQIYTRKDLNNFGLNCARHLIMNAPEKSVPTRWNDHDCVTLDTGRPVIICLVVWAIYFQHVTQTLTVFRITDLAVIIKKICIIK